MKGFVFLAIILLTNASIFAQDSFIMWNENKQLTWTDFKGTAKDSTNYDAEVFAEVRYNYTFYNTTNYSFDVFAIVNQNTSWSKGHKQSTELLKHEQLHFDLAELYARKLKEAFETYPYTSNYPQEITKIFVAIKDEYHRTQQRFDEETNHSLDNLKQQEWATQIQQGLLASKIRLFELANAKKASAPYLQKLSNSSAPLALLTVE